MEIIGIHKALYKVEGHIPARISNVPNWDAETIFFYKFWASRKAGARATMKNSKFSRMSMISYKILKESL